MEFITGNYMLKDIQALRFFAILFVVFLHLPIILPNNHTYNELRSFTNTDSGVELFFVIAGYFLSLTLDKSSNHIKSTPDKVVYLIKTYIKKIKRLSPPVYFWIAIPMLFSLITKNSELWLPYNLMMEKFFASFVWLRNFEEIGTEGNFGYMWALSLEMQFFIIYPLVYFTLGRKKTIITSVVICVIMMFYRPGGGPAWMFRFDPLLYGTLLYYIVSSIDLTKLSLQEINLSPLNKSAIGLMMIISLAVVPQALIHLWTFRFSAAAMISTVCVFLAVMNTGFFTSFPSILNKIFSYIGGRSFSLFCCHIPVWFMIFQLTHGHNISDLSRIILQIFSMFIATELTYQILEKPFIKKK